MSNPEFNEEPDYIEIAKGTLLYIDPYTYAPQGDIMISVLVKRRDFDHSRAGSLKAAATSGGNWTTVDRVGAQIISITIENQDAMRTKT